MNPPGLLRQMNRLLEQHDAQCISFHRNGAVRLVTQWGTRDVKESELERMIQPEEETNNAT